MINGVNCFTQDPSCEIRGIVWKLMKITKYQLKLMPQVVK